MEFSASVGFIHKDFIVFCVSGIVGTDNIISSTNSGLNENRLYQERKNVINTPLINPEKVYLLSVQSKLELIKNVFKDNGSKQRWIYEFEN
jgi:hypothetical protein